MCLKKRRMTHLKFEKTLTINIGAYNSVKLGVSDAPSYLACDEVLITELKRLNLPRNAKINAVLKWQEE